MTIENRQSEVGNPAPSHMVANLSKSCETCRAFVASDGPCPGQPAGGGGEGSVPLCHSRLWPWVQEATTAGLAAEAQSTQRTERS